MLKIPFSNYSSFRQEMVFGLKAYIFQFNYNTRGDYWEFSISDKEQNVLVAGIKIVPDYELTNRYVHKGIPTDLLYALSTSTPNARIAVDDLAKGVFALVYVSPTDLV